MKLRRHPEDFLVEELSRRATPTTGSLPDWSDPERSAADSPRADGQKRFEGSLYRLTKTGITTTDAVDLILRKWQLPRHRLEYGGLKDRHAVTKQYLTIRNGPARGFQTDKIDLEYLGRTDRPFQASDILANRFQLTVRDLSKDACAKAEAALPDVATGLPNYFDDQRFGSLLGSASARRESDGGDDAPSNQVVETEAPSVSRRTLAGTCQFIAEPWIRGDYERAMFLTFAEPYKFDSKDEKLQKQILRDHWGDWLLCKEKLARSNRRSIITYLCDKPKDFRGAWTRTRVDMRSLYLSAFQSYLWNSLAAARLSQTVPAEDLLSVQLKTGPVPFFSRLTDPALLHEKLPLPCARQHLDPGPIQEFVDATLAKMGWTLRELKVKSPRDSFFSKGWRTVAVLPHELSGSSAVDDLYPGRRKLHLSFTLPRGSYATILIKRLFAAEAVELDESAEE